MVGAIGACVHNLGVEGFADWMEDRGTGYVSVKLGPAVPIPEVINKIREARPEVVGISMRLGDLHVDKLITEFVELATKHGIHPRESGIRYAFSGLRPAANVVRAMTSAPLEPDEFTPEAERHFDLEAVAAEYAGREAFAGFFELIADDYITMEQLEDFAEKRTGTVHVNHVEWSDYLVERIQQVRERENRPIIRAHIGIAADTIEPTIAAIEKLAEAEAFEIVSLAPDQPSQEMLAKFIRGEEDPDKYLRGQGGAPIRAIEDLQRLKAASQRGNFPLTRIYTGTDELVTLAELWEEHLNMAFPAVPIFFYNELDGRGPISIRDSFREHYDTIRWWAERGKPLEINDPHQWGLRYASDDMQVTDHVLVAVIALKMGIKHYVMQMMFELPPEISAMDDLAKMCAAYELIEPLTRHYDFNIIRETRSGLPSFPPNLHQAKGHLAFGIYTQLYMSPDILHVVSFPEAHHEAKAEDIIESCEITKQVCWDFKKGNVPDVWSDPTGPGAPARAQARRRLQPAARRPARRLPRAGDRGELLGVGQGAGRRCGTQLRDDAPLVCRRGELPYRHLWPDQPGHDGPRPADRPLPGAAHHRHRPPLRARRRLPHQSGRRHVPRRRDLRQKVSSEFERVDQSPPAVPLVLRRVDPAGRRRELFIVEEVEAIDDVVVAAARRQGVGVRHGELDRLKVLVVDFGSTFTKIGRFDAATEEFSLSYVPTTPDDIRVGLANGLGVLEACQEEGGWQPLEQAMSQFDVRLPCSSAKGGLKMVTVSLVKQESGFAADMAALTAGAKLLNSYDSKLAPQQAWRIYEAGPAGDYPAGWRR
jgi:hypothetical protein